MHFHRRRTAAVNKQQWLRLQSRKRKIFTNEKLEFGRNSREGTEAEDAESLAVIKQTASLVKSNFCLKWNIFIWNKTTIKKLRKHGCGFKKASSALSSVSSGRVCQLAVFVSVVPQQRGSLVRPRASAGGGVGSGALISLKNHKTVWVSADALEETLKRNQELKHPQLNRNRRNLPQKRILSSEPAHIMNPPSPCFTMRSITSDVKRFLLLNLSMSV